MKKTIGYFLLISALFIGLAGCAAVLPSSKTTVVSPWQNFKDIEMIYKKIVPGTTVQELKQWGFDPYTSPNIKILNYRDIAVYFMPNASIQMSDLPEAVQLAIKAKDRSRAYLIQPSDRKKKRTGSFWLDTAKFKRLTNETGWQFQGLIIIVDDNVVYKTPVSGEPIINTKDEQKNPLGPFQELGDWIIGIGKGFIK